jgi:hypothetical protein
MLTGIPIKDLALTSIPSVQTISHGIKDMASKQDVPAWSDKEKLIGAGIGAAGLVGGGLLGYKALKAIREMAAAQQQSSRGKVRVALPTKDPNDQETIIELPIDDLDVSRSQFEKLQRDLRRRIRKETKERTVQRTLGGLMEPKEASVKTGSLHKVNYLLNILNA